VHLITELLSPTAMRRLYRRADAFVSLSRGEGFGLGAFETAAAGTPVIATGFGGHLDYLAGDDALLVDHEVVAVDAVAGSVSYTPDQGWAEPSVAHAAELMRAVVADRADAAARGARLRDRIRREFSTASTTARLVAVLEQTASRTGGPDHGRPVG
jgi:glycosyltransferase involved in cell wall biosynthesis